MTDQLREIRARAFADGWHIAIQSLLDARILEIPPPAFMPLPGAHDLGFVICGVSSMAAFEKYAKTMYGIERAYAEVPRDPQPARIGGTES